MKKFTIGIREVHFRYYSVEAEDANEAVDLVDAQGPGVVDLESGDYSHDCPSDTWAVEMVG